jgi:hypothetical protein
VTDYSHLLLSEWVASRDNSKCRPCITLTIEMLTHNLDVNLKSYSPVGDFIGNLKLPYIYRPYLNLNV